VTGAIAARHVPALLEIGAERLARMLTTTGLTLRTANTAR